MNALEKQLLREEAGGAEPRLCIRTNTRVDTGRWGRRSFAWLCLMEHDVVVVAAARRRYIQRASFDACRDSFYCHATGELVLAPVAAFTHGRLAMSVSDALKVLKRLKTKQITLEKEHA